MTAPTAIRQPTIDLSDLIPIVLELERHPMANHPNFLLTRQLLSSLISPQSIRLYPNYPNPFKENTTFQFYLPEPKKVKLYILNSIGQKVGTLLDEHVLSGLHTFDFTNQPSVWIPEMSVYENHQKLEPGVYIFVLQTNDKIKANKFTVEK